MKMIRHTSVIDALQNMVDRIEAYPDKKLGSGSFKDSNGDLCAVAVVYPAFLQYFNATLGEINTVQDAINFEKKIIEEKIAEGVVVDDVWVYPPVLLYDLSYKNDAFSGTPEERYVFILGGLKKILSYKMRGK